MKIAICVDLNPTLKELVVVLKKNLRKNFMSSKKLFYFDHEPHITVCAFNSSIPKLIISKLESHKFENIIFRVSGFSKFEKDPITNGTTIFLKIVKSRKITNFQKEILNLLHENVDQIQDYNKIKDEKFKKNLINYKYPFVNKEWIPHITIGSIPNSKKKIDKNFFDDLSLNVNFSFDKLQIVNMDKDNHTIIKKIKIKK